jgi:LPXTG-motif cell wall-anchored protein
MLCLLVAPKAKADDWNRKTVVTFSAPVEVPGVGLHLLPAGTYLFKVMDSAGDRHIVQIMNEDGTHVFTTVLAIPNYRLKATDKTVMTFRERPAGEPEALRAWFYPGHEWGEQFVYERSRATLLAKETNEAVLSTDAVTETSTPDDLKTAAYVAVGPTGDTVDTATVVDGPPTPVAAPEVTAEPVMVASLPKTGSDLPLIGLAGLLALSGGLALTGLLKHSA